MIGLLTACSLENKSFVNRQLQNLTAHYNIIFNANDLLRQKEEIYAAGFIDNYNSMLRVYQDTTARGAQTIDKELDGIISRANTIINIKEQSHYIGDAYLLLARASYLYGSYFNANEYCNYVVHSFPKNAQLVQHARALQVRTLLNLNKRDEAKVVSDTALIILQQTKKKKNEVEVYAARLQYDLDVANYDEAEQMAKEVIRTADNAQLRRRVTFILAQVQEQNHKPREAITNYNKIAGSNAAFEMAFNAQLNRIRIEEDQSGKHLSRIDRLKSLLRNQNNLDFTDQIYYQIGELYMAENKINEAIKNYRLSTKYSTKNQNQKGLSYLRLADISFKNKGDYIEAKKWYDSTLTVLLPNYPGYRTIQLKANNLQTLAQQLKIISHEDTLQQLAKMNEADRKVRINEMVDQLVTAQQYNPATTAPTAFTNANTPTTSLTTAAIAGSATFYFYNTNAVSQGFADFKRRWGNRLLEDNWRRSNRANSNITTNTQNTSQQTGPGVLPQTQQKSTDEVLANNYRQEITSAVPITPQALAESNIRVFNAYYTIANFYRDVLQDSPEAIRTYELLLSKFPDNTETPAVYYNLYRLYSEKSQAKSDEYRDLLLKKYPESVFARVIRDPEYGRHLNDLDAEFNAFYNQLYELYVKKQYKDVVTRADQLLLQYADHKFAAQIAYLKALAAGHQEKLQPFLADLQAILIKYPNDQLIAPLVSQHIDFINANQAELAARPTALVENDNFLSPFLPTPVTQQAVVVQQKPQVAKPNQTAPAATAPVKTASALFSMRDSSRYYFVVNVATGTTNLSSSRFGIGQFNRANFAPEAGIKHQLTNAGPDNQLIYVGMFHSLSMVKDYARAIIPLMPQIMKVPADKYSFFIITQENLDKLADKKMLDLYIDFYQKNY
ncbi:tetratricopeptide repeat protein [Mucilaginibacter straminoryzae]|nr:hypothetical protein [Mucilaginibacter straminoryzae]